MELFIKVCFWVMAFGFFTKLLCLGIVPYPRETKRWNDMVDLMLSLPLIVWAWYLTWG